MPDEPKKTTVNVSLEFAEALREAARAAGVSVAAYCDGRYLTDARQVAALALKKRLTVLQPTPPAPPAVMSKP